MTVDLAAPVRSRAMLFRDKLLDLMRQRGWSVNDLARESGLTYPTVRSYTSGGKAKRLPTLVNAAKLAKALGVSVEVFAECTDIQSDTE